MRVLCVLTLVWASVGSAQDADSEVANPEPAVGQESSAALRVVVAGNAPFILPGTPPEGISVRVWEELAEELEREFELVRADSVADALTQLEHGAADVAIGPISITAERAERVAFTQPYFESHISILAPASTPSFWQRVRPFASGSFLKGVGVFLLFMLVVGHLLWRAERKTNEEFPEDPLRGTGVGLWLVVVTMTTVGYGDTSPRTPRGRFIAGLFMLVSMVSVSSLTAFLATTLTVASLEHGSIASASELHGREVAAVAGSTGAEFARHHGARVTDVPDVQAGVDACAAGTVDAVVYDRPMLRYALRNHPEGDLALSASSYEPQGYGFAVRHDDAELESSLDVALLELAENGTIDRIVTQWLGSAE